MLNKKGGLIAGLLMLSVLFSTVAECSLAKKQATVIAVDIQPGERIRAIEVDWWPTVDPRVLQIKAAEASQTTGLAHVSAVQFVISNFQQVAMAFGFYAAAAQVPTAQNPNATAAVAQAAFFAVARLFLVFEYVDGNAIDGYQQGTTDNITGFYDLSHKDLQWKPMQFAATNITDSNNNVFTVHTVTLETMDEVFLLRVVSAERPVTVNGHRINPDSLKVDFAVKWFNNANHVRANWTTGPSNEPNAQVAVLAVAAAEGGASVVEVGGQEPALHFGAGAFVGFFSWQPNADVTVQGATAAAAVVAHVVDTSSDPNIQAAFAAGWIIRVAVFSFTGIRPSEVVWDPSFGAQVDYQQLATQSSSQNTQNTQSQSTTSSQDANSGAISLISSISLVIVAIAALLL